MYCTFNNNKVLPDSGTKSCIVEVFPAVLLVAMELVRDLKAGERIEAVRLWYKEPPKSDAKNEPCLPGAIGVDVAEDAPDPVKP